MENIKRIVVTGPESTGKTVLSQMLSKKMDCPWIPEYAREYVENLGGIYGYSDVEAIGRKQIEEYKKYTAHKADFLIFDTWLIITKVWFQLAFGKVPGWINSSIQEMPVSYYLLCYPDLEWQPDKVRENGGKKRLELFSIYKEEIEQTGIAYGIIKGEGEERFRMAERLVNNQFNL